MAQSSANSLQVPTVKRRRSSIHSLVGLAQSARKLSASPAFECSLPSIETLAEELKAKVIENYESNKKDYEKVDLEHVLETTDLKYLERYLTKTGLDVNKAFKILQERFKFCKAIKVFPAIENQFPKLFHEYGQYFLYKTDIDGNIVLHIRAKVYYRFHRAFEEAMLRFLFYQILRADMIGAREGSGFTICVDFSGASVTQSDSCGIIEALQFYVNYCPYGLRRVLLHDLKWILKPFLKVILSVSPSSLKDLVIPVSKGNLVEYISEENLPRYLGGKGKRSEIAKDIPDGCPTLEDYFLTNYRLAKPQTKQLLMKHRRVIQLNDW